MIRLQVDLPSAGPDREAAHTRLKGALAYVFQFVERRDALKRVRRIDLSIDDAGATHLVLSDEHGNSLTSKNQPSDVPATGGV